MGQLGHPKGYETAAVRKSLREKKVFIYTNRGGDNDINTGE